LSRLTQKFPICITELASSTPNLASKILILGMIVPVHANFELSDIVSRYYNKTSYSGLETDIPNSYANSLIQLLHYCIPIRRLGKSHITTSCRTEHCLLCEFGFVARMLEDAQGINVQARNFCVTVGRKQTGNTLSERHPLQTNFSS